MRKTLKLKPKNFNNTASRNLIGIFISNIVALIILFLLTILFSFILLKSEKATDSYLMYFYFCSGLSSLIGGFIASKKCKFKGIISGAISSVSLFILIAVILLFVSKGHIGSDTAILYAVLAVFSIIGGIAGANTKSRK